MEGARVNTSKSGLGGGGGLTVCGYLFQCGFWKREEGI